MPNSARPYESSREDQNDSAHIRVHTVTSDEDNHQILDELPANQKDNAIPITPTLNQQDSQTTQKQNHEKTTATGAEAADASTRQERTGRRISRQSKMSETQKRARSITNYYNILSQHMQNKKEQSEASNQEESLEKRQTLNEAECSSVAHEPMESPSLKNLNALTINYHSNQNYQSINFYDANDEPSKEYAGTGPTNKGIDSTDKATRNPNKKSFKNSDYSNQFSTIKRCQ